MKKFFVPKETKVVFDDGLTAGGLVRHNEAVNVEDVVSIGVDEEWCRIVMVYEIVFYTRNSGMVCWSFTSEEERDEVYHDLLSSLNED